VPWNLLKWEYGSLYQLTYSRSNIYMAWTHLSGYIFVDIKQIIANHNTANKVQNSFIKTALHIQRLLLHVSLFSVFFREAILNILAIRQDV